MQVFTFLDLAKNELRNGRLHNLGSDPTPAAGDLGYVFYRSDTKQLKVWNGTTFDLLNLANSVAGTAPITASIAAGVLTVSISAASGGAAGSMSSAHYTLVNNATAVNTGGALVLRDGSNNFAAGTITAALTGTASNATQLNNQSDTFYLARANHTGTQLAATISNLAATVQAYSLSTFAAPTSALAAGGFRITGVADPTSAQDAATKNYVDSVAAGFDVKASVRVASTGPITLATGMTSSSTVDGTALALGDRVLLKNQATASENGVWIVTAGAPTRSTDMNGNSGSGSNGTNPGSFVFVEQGTTLSATAWVLVTQAPITINTTGLTFSQVGASVAYTAGNGINLGGNSFSAVGTTNRISVGAGGIDIAATYVGQTSITTLGTVTAGTWTGTTIAVANGGTGATTAAAARTNLGATFKATATLTGNGALTSFTATHNLGTIDHISEVWDSGNNLLTVDIVRGANADTITITPAPANAVAFTFVAVG